MAPLRYAAKFDPFLFLDCVRMEGVGHNPRKERDQILPSGNTALRTTEGTTPEGSEWTRWYDGEDYPASGYGWKDLVQVPESLEPGDYILSFRWDCQQTAQIWQTCANVEIL